MNKQEWLITIIIFIIITLMFWYGEIVTPKESILDEYPPSSETLV